MFVISKLKLNPYAKDKQCCICTLTAQTNF